MRYMMKKHLFAVIAILSFSLFAACSAMEDRAEFKKPEHIAQISAYNAGDNTEQMRSDYISSLSAEDMLSRERLAVLSRAGVRVKGVQAEENGDGTLIVTVQLENAKGRVIDLSLTAMLNFSAYGDGFHGEEVYWGSLNAADNEIILTSLNDIYIIDINKMSVKNTGFEISGINGGNYYLGDTVKKGDEYITCCYDELTDKNKLITFASDGSLKQVAETTYNFFGRKCTGPDYAPYPLYLDSKTELFFMDKEENFLAEKDKSGGVYVCNLQTGEFFYYREILDVTTAAGRVVLRGRESVREQKDLGKTAALYDENGVITDSFETDITPHHCFGESYYLERSNLSLETAQPEDNVFVVFNPYFAQQITLNFNTKTARAEYIYDERWLCEETSLSPDGKYAIVTGSYNGAGDVYFRDNALLEKETGKMKHIGQTGGMYGGRETGFLKNGDVYCYGFVAFDIYDCNMDNPNPVWRLGDFIPLGKTEAGEGNFVRYLMAARRDPGNKSVTAVYFDLPETDNSSDLYADYEKDTVRLKATYRILRISQSGVIEYDCDTGCNVLSPNGFVRVSIYPEDNENMHIYGWLINHNNIWFEGSINLTDGKYTAIKDYTGGQ